MAAPAYDTVYNTYSNSTFDTTSNTAFTATQVITSTSNAFPYYDIDSSLPATYGEASSTGNNERSSVTVTTKTYELLPATFILIMTSLILLIVQSIFSYIHLRMHIIHQGNVWSYENGYNPLNGYSPELMDIPQNGFPLYDYDTVKWLTLK